VVHEKRTGSDKGECSLHTYYSAVLTGPITCGPSQDHLTESYLTLHCISVANFKAVLIMIIIIIIIIRTTIIII
jgi:hypothetical protein